MASDKPVLHGADHRPPGWNGPDDPGARDPLRWLARVRDPKLPTIVVAQNYTAALAVETSHHVAFDGDMAAATNDGGFTLDGTPPTDPFTGDYFSFDFGSNANKVYITAAGIYLVSRTFQINDVDDGTMVSGQNFIQMDIENTEAGTVFMPLDSAQLSSLGVSKIVGVTYAGIGFNSSKNVAARALVMSDGSPIYGQELFVSHHGLEGDATNWDATITIARLGNHI